MGVLRLFRTFAFNMDVQAIKPGGTIRSFCLSSCIRQAREFILTKAFLPEMHPVFDLKTSRDGIATTPGSLC